MRSKMFNKVLSALLAVVMCIGMLPAMAVSAAAADLGSNEWVVRNDDFSSYPTGVDTFWKNDKYTGFSNSYHSYTLAEADNDPAGTIYGPRGTSSYNIVDGANGDKWLELVSVDMCGTRITLPTVSGAYSMTMDLYMPKSTGSSVPGVILNLGYKGQVYIDGGDGVRLMGVGLTSPDYYVKDGTQKMPFALNTWYTVKMSMEPGRFIVKFWPRGGQEPADDAAAGVFVFEDETDLTAEKLSSGMTPTITTRSRGTKTAIDANEYVVRLDNLKITKPFADMTLPAQLSGKVGERVAVGATFSGQDLNAQLPAPKFNYTFSNPALGSATPNGYVAFAAEGQGTLTVELADIDGNGTGFTRQVPVSVAGQADTPLRILSIGNDYSGNTLYYVDKLAALVGEQVEVAYLSMTDATLRYHAHNVAMKTADYSYYKSDSSGVPVEVASAITINDVVEGENWDIVMLQQGGAAVGMNNTFAGDLRFLLDYLADVQPNAEVYWNMNTAEGSGNILADYYDNSQNVMYNAIVGCLDMFIVGEDARYANDFDGWFPVGAAIQNLRAAAGDTTLTSETENGRLAAAMTVLKVLFPEAGLDSITAEELGITADLDLIRQSVAAACTNLNAAPAKLAVSPETIETASKDPSQVTVGQTDAPLNLRFADIVVTKDGTVYAGAYESVTHVPARGKLPYTEYCPEGYGRLKIWKGSSDGKSWDFDNPVLTIDQQELDDWGVSPDLYNRYERLQNGAQDYAFFNDARDANLGLMYHDMDGDGTEDEVLLFTFFCNDYNESGTSTFRGTFLMHSIDGGKTWSVPQRIQSKALGNGGGKRGDIAVFDDGQILFPMYSHPKVSGVLLQWNVTAQQWDTIADTEIPNYVPEKTTDFTEPSFIAPDPDGDTVYGFVRDNGQAVISYDRGRSWEHIHTIDGNVQQPGWAYIDENRAFATWSFADGGTRPTKGQMVYFDAGWEATQPTVVHEYFNRSPRDTGDPSAKLLQNGKLLTINYDTEFRAINGKFLDLNATEFQLPELSDEAGEATLQTVTPGSASLTVNNLPDSHTLNFTATFASGGKLAVTAANGAVVELKAGSDGIRVNKETEVRIAVINGATYTKVWAVGSAAPAEWTVVKGGTAINSGKAVFAGSAVTLGEVTVTRRAVMVMNQGGDNTLGMGIATPLTINPADMANKVIWETSNPAVATVDQQGNISFVGAGKATVTATLGNKSVSASYEVGEAAGEVTGAGETKVLFRDDFESYTTGDNTFYSAMTSSGYAAIPSAYAKTGYNIVAENGNKHLQLIGSEGKANYPWAIVDTPIFGDYTVQ
ncbi:MAG: DUF4886 domain-containing protein, partial [Oscillospiraceae bacterium]|nr:DUF4886 domain-containing protein [Oscillospiraceae bacterium]